MRRKFCLVGIIILLVLLSGTIYAQDNNRNLAVDRVISGNTTDVRHPVDYLVDNNLETSWGFKAETAQGWAEIKLKKASLIHGLELSGSLDEKAELIIEYKEDNRWKPFLASRITELAETEFIDLSFGRVVTDKLRLKVLGSGAEKSYISEVKVIGNNPEEVYHQVQVKEVTASKDTAPTYPAKFLIDNNTYTMWKAVANFSYGRGNTDQLEEFLEQENTSSNQPGNDSKVSFTLQHAYELSKTTLQDLVQ